MKALYPQIPSPCFVLEENKFRSNLQLIKDLATEADVEFILAFKGFSMWSAFDIVREYIHGATASSLHEAEMCSQYMHTPSHTYMVAIADDEIDAILDLSSHISFNSLTQYERYKEKAKHKKVSMGLRVNPQFSKAHTELYNPGSPQSRLGVSPEYLQQGLPADIEGLHFHVLCENNSYDLEEVLVHVEKHFSHLLPSIQWLNMGGGHLVTHQDYDQNHFVKLIQNFKAKYPHLHLIFEPGSAYAWQTGFLKASVLDLVCNDGVQTANLDVSFTAHMPDCLEMPYKPAIRHATDTLLHTDTNAFRYRMGGTSCLAGDYMSEYNFPTALNIGDEIILEDMIHYTMVKTSTFNGVKHPSIGILRADGRFDLIRRFGYTDFVQKLS